MNKISTNNYYNKQEKVGDLDRIAHYYGVKEHEDEPKIGDVEIQYNYFDTTKVRNISILAKQKGDSFEPFYMNKYEKELYYVFEGKIDTKVKLEKALNNVQKKDTRGKIIFILIIVALGVFFIVDSKKKS